MTSRAYDLMKTVLIIGSLITAVHVGASESFSIAGNTHVVNRSKGKEITLNGGSGTYNISSAGTAFQGGKQAYSATYLYYPEPDGTIVLTAVPNNSSITINAEGGSVFAFFADEINTLWDNSGSTTLTFSKSGSNERFTIMGNTHVVSRSKGKEITLSGGSGSYNVSSAGTAFQGEKQAYSATYLYYPEPDGTIVLTAVPNNGSITINAEGGSVFAFFADETNTLWDNSGMTTLTFSKL